MPDQTRPEQSYLEPAPVGDTGPIRRPDFVGLCSEHGWWFPARSAHEEWCPEAGCDAKVFLYVHAADFQPSRRS